MNKGFPDSSFYYPSCPFPIVTLDVLIQRLFVSNRISTDGDFKKQERYTSLGAQGYQIVRTPPPHQVYLRESPNETTMVEKVYVTYNQVCQEEGGGSKRKEERESVYISVRLRSADNHGGSHNLSGLYFSHFLA